MKLVALATTVAVALVLAGGAGAAKPIKGTEYVGVIKSSPFEMKVLLGVSQSGTKARFTYLCGTGRAAGTVHFPSSGTEARARITISRGPRAEDCRKRTVTGVRSS